MPHSKEEVTPLGCLLSAFSGPGTLCLYETDHMLIPRIHSKCIGLLSRVNCYHWNIESATPMIPCVKTVVMSSISYQSFSSQADLDYALRLKRGTLIGSLLLHNSTFTSGHCIMTAPPCAWSQYYQVHYLDLGMGNFWLTSTLLRNR